jgi:hypothetical protein
VNAMDPLTRFQDALRRGSTSLLWDYHRLRGRVSERAPLRAFERFMASLPARPRPLFMFFTSQLLHFAAKALEFLPRDQHVVLIGAALTPEERAWLDREVDRPFHHIDRYVDDRVVWDFLFATASTDFGWLDVDCFVQNPQLLPDLFAFERDAAINCVWSYRTRGGHRILCTHLVAINHDVLTRVRATGIPTSPIVYSFEPKRRSGYRHSYTRRPTRSQLRLIDGLLPSTDNGRPAYPSAIPEKGNLAYFDTLTMYQLCAEALGYRLRAVRDLQGTNTLDRHFSDEVVHINAASYYRGFKHAENPEYRPYFRMLLPFDYLLLRSQAARLPRLYATRLADMEADLAELGIPTAGLGAQVREVFRARGVSDRVFEQQAWRFLEDQPCD